MRNGEIMVASNRGPISFSFGDGDVVVPGRAGGGLAGTLHRLLDGKGAMWVAAAMNDADVAAAKSGSARELLGDGIDVRLVAPPADIYRMAYDLVSNSTLWFVHHHLYDLAREPRFGRGWQEAWDGYREYNRLFASTIAEVARERSTLLVQDYHLSLLPGMLARQRPDLATVHFSHTPFAAPDSFSVLPQSIATELATGMSAARACGFHSARWAACYESSCKAVGVPPAPAFHTPLGVDPVGIATGMSAPEAAAARASVEEIAGGRFLLARVDRMEPSKNILRGLWAYDELLAEHPDVRERMVFLVLAYPSRTTLAAYRAYAAEVEAAVSFLNEKWASPGWTPIVLGMEDDWYRSLAAMSLYDALLVNPVRDGLNLVAKEGALANERSGTLVLSTEAGVYDELEGPCLAVNPFDMGATAGAIYQAFAMDPGERHGRAKRLKELALSHTSEGWLADQLAAAR